uniref:Growth-regulating factor n=1 Tax=Aegilops tauschii TaxID=37682 RepID=M8CZU7_AEGTA
MSGARWAARRPATFTAAQYQELEQQALIYKYLVAGVPVPPDLLLPIRRGFDSLASRFYHHHALGYGSYFGKKLDPEPGRCRRTDGKKWRCSKEAAQDSKYSAYGFRTSALEEHNQFISAAMDTAMDNYSWRLMPSQPSSFSLASYPMLGTLGDLDQSAICSLAKTEREPLSFGGGGGFEDDESAVKQENQTLRPFFDEWPKDRDSWPELQDHDSNHNSNAFSATKLSISIPVTSSDFSTTAGSRSPHGRVEETTGRGRIMRRKAKACIAWYYTSSPRDRIAIAWAIGFGWMDHGRRRGT